MQIKKKLLQKSFVLPLLGTIGWILWLYYPILFKYFEQDEWRDYGWHIYYSHLFSFPSYLLYIIKTSSIPFTSLYNAFNYLIFGINNWFSAVVVLLLICINVFLWVVMLNKLTKNILIGVGSVLLGYTNFISSQAVTWVMPAVSSQLSLLFILLALLAFFSYLEKREKKILLFMIAACVLSIFSKLNSFFIVLLLPIAFLIYDKKYTFKKKTVMALLSGLVLSGICFGIFFLKFGFIQLGTTRYVKSIFDIFFNALILPIKSISQIVLSDPAVIYKMIAFILEKRYHFGPNSLYEQTILTEMLSIILSLLFVILFVVLFITVKKWRKPVVFLGVFYILTFTPFMLDTYSTGNGFLESRYYQIAVFPLATMICMLLYALWSFLRVRIPTLFARLAATLLLIFLLLYLGFNCILIRQNLNNSIAVTTKRKEILSYISTQAQAKKRTKIILSLVEKNYPGTMKNVTGFLFQTGLFYPFLVSNFENGKIPYTLFLRDDIWSYDYQGVVRERDTVYGIFYSQEALTAYLKQYPEDTQAVTVIEVDFSKLHNNPNYTGGVKDLLYADVKVRDEK